MISKFLSFTLFGLVIYGIGFQPVLAATGDDSKLEKIKCSVRELSKHDSPKVVVKMKNGTKIEGHISQVLDGSFDVVSTETRQTATILYGDVSSVKRQGWSKGSKIALGVGVAAAVTVAVIAGVVGKKGLSGFCPLGCSTMLRP